MPRNLESFAASFFRVGRAWGEGAPADERAWVEALGSRNTATQLWEIMQSDPAEAWRLIVELVNRAPDEEDLAWVAASPLEDFLDDHGDEFVEAILAEGQANPRMREAFNGVWGWDRFAPAVRERLLPLLKPELVAYWLKRRREDPDRAPEIADPGVRPIRPKDRFRVPSPRAKKDRFR